MPDILIRGISLAECFGKTIEIGRDADGDVFAYVDNGQTAVLDVAELPPHGDLIDVSKIVLEYGGLAKISPHDFVGIAKYFAKQIEGQPVVVPAERRDADA